VRVQLDGVAETLDALLVPCLERAYAYALRLVKNRADAEDLVQEAALAACKGFATFQPGTNFRRWFFQILTNCFYARHRKRHLDVEVGVDDYMDLPLFDGAEEQGLLDRSSDPARELLSSLDREAIDDALQSLPDDFRVVAALYFVEDLPYAEIADIVTVPVGTVRSRLHRARRLLQKQLWRVAVDRGIVADMQGERA
jgi:RNA polymerase sigma-70 factor (ECF subfamily)